MMIRYSARLVRIVKPVQIASDEIARFCRNNDDGYNDDDDDEDKDEMLLEDYGSQRGAELFVSR